MTKPIFGLTEIKHQSTKARKDFILDCLFIGVGISILYVSLNEEFAEGVKTIHKNKYRKNIAKIRNVYDTLRDKQVRLMKIMSNKDMYCIEAKIKDRVAKTFIQELSTTNKEVVLEYVAIGILEAGLNRLNRKTKIHSYLETFKDIKLLYKTIGLEISKTGFKNMDYEYELAQNFVKSIKY